MALIKCPECKGKISDTTDSCPKCGYKITPEEVAELKEKKNMINMNELKKSIAILLIMCAVAVIFFYPYVVKKKEIKLLGETYSEFVIKVSGDSRFIGSYMTVTEDGNSTSRSVDGTAPAEFNVKGYLVSCCFQKQEEYGSLEVKIIKDDKVLSQGKTSASYGVVSVGTTGR
ncbi:MAG: hypothetical protein V1871_04235 [Planctomycetota bacterium]